MSVILHPAIERLDPKSLCYSIYSQLYHNFFNAQDKKDEAHPWGVEEGDETSVRLKNTAYGFAEAFAGTAQGESIGGINGALLDYLKKTGGDMTGRLTANYGFEAGVGNNRVLEVFKREEKDGEGNVLSTAYGVNITGELHVGGDSLFIGGKRVLSYDNSKQTALIDSLYVDFGNSSLHSAGELLFGESKENGVFLSPQTVLIKGKTAYHAGNANLASVDWTMNDGHVAGDLEVKGSAAFSDLLRACRGVELGLNGNAYLTMTADNIHANRFLSFASGYGVKIANVPVLIRANETDIVLGAAGGDLLLGNETTNKIRLQAGIADTDGDYVLLNKYGAAYFPGSLTTEASDKGTQALGTVHKKVEDKVAQADRRFVLDVLNYEMTDIFLAFGINTKGGEFCFSEPKDIDLVGKVNMLATLHNTFGLPISDDYLYNETGVEKPKNYEQLKAKQEQAVEPQQSAQAKENLEEEPNGTGKQPEEPAQKEKKKFLNKLKGFFVQAPHSGAALDW